MAASPVFRRGLVDRPVDSLIVSEVVNNSPIENVRFYRSTKENLDRSYHRGAKLEEKKLFMSEKTPKHFIHDPRNVQDSEDRRGNCYDFDIADEDEA